jgi:hypothetical protein
MKYFTEGLSKKQIKVLKALGPHMAPKGFYLAGGTALAIHYGHRLSVDLDWFTPQSFKDFCDLYALGKHRFLCRRC